MSFHREVEKIRSKLATHPWPKYLDSIKISGLRGWRGEEVRFQFPVTVIAGENGAGKSTVLKAAAVAYSNPSDRRKTYFPLTFFPDTPWDTVENAEIIYKITEGGNTHNFWYRKRSRRWRRAAKRLDRVVIFQDISRTLPLDATVGYAKIANRAAAETSSSELDAEMTRYYSSILGRMYSNAKFAKSNVDMNREVGVVQIASETISQFHLGAGEDATLDLMKQLQAIPDTSLILIDEIEASLHPRSQRRLVHFLLWLARAKHIQVIITTHSPYVLEELPPDARILLERTDTGIQVLPAISADFAMNRMDDIDRPELYIFVEDIVAKIWLSVILNTHGIDMSRVKLTTIGPTNLINAMAVVINNQRFPVPALAIVDGDAPPEYGDGALKLPGDMAPEIYIFNELESSLEELAKELNVDHVKLLRAYEHAQTANDHHDYPKMLSRELGLSFENVWETMCRMWARSAGSNDSVSLIVDTISEKLNGS